MKAYAAAVPVLASAAGGFPEIVQDGVTGLLLHAGGLALGRVGRATPRRRRSERLGMAAWNLWKQQYGPELRTHAAQGRPPASSRPSELRQKQAQVARGMTRAPITDLIQ